MPNSDRKKSEAIGKLTKTVEEPTDTTSLKTNPKPTNESKNKQREKIIEHGLLLQYQIPVLDIKRPKTMMGPFTFNDVQDLRDLRLHLKNNCKQQINSVNASYQFYEDLEFADYFKNKSNWACLPKYTSTSSFLASTQTYLPHVKIDEEVIQTDKEYREIHSRISNGSHTL